MDSINKTSKIVIIIAVILFVVIVVGFVIGMYTLYQKIIVNDDSAVEEILTEIKLTVPNFNTVNQRIPDVLYSYEDEGDISFGLSNDFYELDPLAKAVPFSKKASYYEFTKVVDQYRDGLASFYHVDPVYLWKVNDSKLWNPDNYIIFESSPFCFWPHDSNFIPYYVEEPYDLLVTYSNHIISSIYHNGLLDIDFYYDFYVRGSGAVLKLVDTETGNFLLQGGYDLQTVLSDRFLDITFTQDEEIIPDSGYIPPKDNLVLRIDGSTPIHTTRITNRTIFDPNNQYSDYDYAEFYSYDDSYFEIIVSYSFKKQFSNEIISDKYYIRFRIY